MYRVIPRLDDVRASGLHCAHYGHQASHNGHIGNFAIHARGPPQDSRGERFADQSGRRALHYHPAACSVAAVRPAITQFLRKRTDQTHRLRIGRRAARTQASCIQRAGRFDPHRQAKALPGNADSPVFEELCGWVVKSVAMAEPIRGALEPLRDRIVLALVYGSVAKRTGRAASAIDLLVVADQVTQH